MIRSRALVMGLSLPPLFALFSCSDDTTGPRVFDTMPPRAVVDLRVASAGDDGVVLEWTATGDDGAIGRVSRYDVRYSSEPIDARRWPDAVEVPYPDLPNLSGITEEFEISGLTRGTWYFALRSADEVPNWSELSNVASGFVGDDDPPAAVTDLLAVVEEGSVVRLSWTAPGDDDMEGRAAEYDLRHSPEPITEQAWSSATRVDGLPTPSNPGTRESFTVSDLPTGRTYHFALRTADEGPNWSALSNGVGATLSIDVEPPATVTDLAASDITGRTVVLRWTAPGDDGQDGVASEYDLRYAEEPIDEAGWADATPVAGEPVPERPGTVQSILVDRLDPLTTYYFGLRTADEVPNWSGVSSLVSVTTGDAWPLTRGPEETPGGASNPAWSPDGTMIAFDAGWDGDGEIYVISADGGAPIQLTDDPGVDTQPAWSPDGDRIAFISTRGRERGALWVMDAAPGAVPTLFASHADTTYLSEPAWSPDGTRIAYGEAFGSIFSPFAIWSVPATGGEPERLVAPGAEWGNWSPAWSPDGANLLVLSTREFSWDLWVVPLAGGPWTRLTYGPGFTFNRGGTWSLDGRRIVYESSLTGDFEIFLLPVDGGARERFTREPGYDGTPAWSPSGDRIAYVSDRSGRYEIWVQVLPS